MRSHQQSQHEIVVTQIQNSYEMLESFCSFPLFDFSFLLCIVFVVVVVITAVFAIAVLVPDVNACSAMAQILIPQVPHAGAVPEKKGK